MAIEKRNKGDNQPGFPAKTYNKIADVVNAWDAGRIDLNRKSFDVFRSACVVEVLNDSGGSRQRLDVLGVKEPIILPASDEEEFKNRLRVKGTTPGDDHEPHNFVILLQPLDGGEVGFGVIAGASVAKINVLQEEHEWAGVKSGTTTSLESRDSGGARILWKESGTGLKFGIVRFSGGSSEVAIVKVDGSGCSSIHDDSFHLWSGTVQEIDLGAGTMANPWTNGQDCWIFLAGGCPNPSEGHKIKAGSRYRAHLKGTYRDRPLYCIDLPGLVSVDEQDNPDYLWEQLADQITSQGNEGDIAAPTTNSPVEGSIIINAQKVLDGLDKKLRFFEYVASYDEGKLQVISHPEGSATKTWLEVEEIDVITDLRVVGNVLEKKTATIKILGQTDNGWQTAIQGTYCEDE